MSPKLSGMGSLKLSKDEKRNMSRLEPKPSIKGTVEQRVTKLKDP